MYLRGSERILIDLLENPELAEAIFGRIVEFYLDYGNRILEAARGKIDILCGGDDFGSQHGPLISPAAWRRFLEPGFRALVGLGRAHGVKVMHHSCGSVAELIPDMCAAGLDILQSLQPEAAGMDPAALKAGYGARLAFHGGISIQNVLPLGSPEEVREHAAGLLRAMAPGGGFIACSSHNIQADVPFANIAALLEAYRDFGTYPTAW
jgi:uroporphyrinogen decarboxylase